MPSDFDLAGDNATCPRAFLVPLFFVSCTARRNRKAHFFFNVFPDNYIWKCPKPSTVPGTWKAHNKYLVCEHTGVLHMLSVTWLALKNKLVEKGGKTNPGQQTAGLFRVLLPVTCRVSGALSSYFPISGRNAVK